MLHTLKLQSGEATAELTYDGLGLRIEGNVKVVQRASKRSVADLTVVPIAKVHILTLYFDANSHLLRIHALVPRQAALPDSPLDLVSFLCTVSDDKSQEAQAFAASVLEHVYEGIQKEKRLKVLINPFGGQGRAAKIFNEKVMPVFDCAKCKVDVQYTERQGHAVDIARELDIDAYDAIVTVSGDGVIHEVLNGFSQRPDARLALKKVPLGVIPGGTGNALSICLLGEVLGFDPVHTALQVIKGKPMAFDTCSVTFDDHRYMSFLSHNYGITSYADLATENMRWMGDARTILGLLQQILTRQTYSMEAALLIEESSKDKILDSFEAARAPSTSSEPNVEPGEGLIKDTIPDISEAVPDNWTKINSDISFFLTSKAPWLARGMLSHPCALPNDGLLDLLLVRGNNSLLKELDIFGKVEKGHHVYSDAVEYYKVKAFRLTPIEKKGKKAYVAIDGEHAPVKTFQVQVHPGLGTVLSLHGNFANQRTYRPSFRRKKSSSSSGASKLRDKLAYIISLIKNFFGDAWRKLFRRQGFS